MPGTTLDIERPKLVEEFRVKAASQPLVVVTGEGGSGKSQLVTQAVNQNPAGRTPHLHSFYNAGLHRLKKQDESHGEDALPRSALLAFLRRVDPQRAEGVANSQPWAIAQEVVDVLRSEPWCLILDGVEAVHDPERDHGTGPTDPAVAELIKGLSGPGCFRGVCLMTHRRSGIVPDRFQFEVPPLSDDEIGSYLGKRGIEFDVTQMEEATRLIGRRPITWRAAATLLDVVAETSGPSKSLSRLGEFGVGEREVRQHGSLGAVVLAMDHAVQHDEAWGWPLVRLSGFFESAPTEMIPWSALKALAEEVGVELPEDRKLVEVSSNLERTGLATISTIDGVRFFDVHQEPRSQYAKWLRGEEGERDGWSKRLGTKWARGWSQEDWRKGHQCLLRIYLPKEEKDADTAGQKPAGRKRPPVPKSTKKRQDSTPRSVLAAAAIVKALSPYAQGLYHIGQAGGRSPEDDREWADELVRCFQVYWEQFQQGTKTRLVLNHGLVDSDQDLLHRFLSALGRAPKDDPRLKAIEAVVRFYWCRNAWHIGELKQSRGEFIRAAEGLLDLGWVASSSHAWRHRSEVSGALGLIEEAISNGTTALHLLSASRWPHKSAKEYANSGSKSCPYQVVHPAEPVRLYCEATLARAYHFAGRWDLATPLFADCGPEVAALPNWGLVWWYWNADCRLDEVREAINEPAVLAKLRQGNETSVAFAREKKDPEYDIPPLDEGLYWLVRARVQTRQAVYDRSARRQLLTDSRTSLDRAQRDIGRSHQRPWAAISCIESARVYLSLGFLDAANRAVEEAEHIATLTTPEMVPLNPNPTSDGVLWSFLADVRLIQGELAITRFRADEANECVALAERIVNATGYHRRKGDLQRLCAVIRVAGGLREAIRGTWAVMRDVRQESAAHLDYARYLAHDAIITCDQKRPADPTRTEHPQELTPPPTNLTEEQRTAVERQLRPALAVLQDAVNKAVGKLVIAKETGQAVGLERDAAFPVVRSFVLAALERDPDQALEEPTDSDVPNPIRYVRGQRPPVPPVPAVEELKRIADDFAVSQQPSLKEFKAILRVLANTAYSTFEENRKLVSWVNEIAHRLDVMLYVRTGDIEGPVTLRCRNPKTAGTFEAVYGVQRESAFSSVGFPPLSCEQRKPGSSLSSDIRESAA